MGEAMNQGFFADRWRVRRDGRLVFADTAWLEGAIATRLIEPAVTGGGIAIATVLIAPGGDAELASVRALNETFAGEVGISAWNGIRSGPALRQGRRRAAPRSDRGAGGARSAGAAALVKLGLRMIPKSGNRFSDKIMRKRMILRKR